jgi:hypothetical protein
MKTLTKMAYGLVLAPLLSLEANSQTVFSAGDLPSHTGQYSRMYFSTNVDLSTLLGQPGGPRRWDFSQTQQPNESVRRTDVVTTDDGGQGASFPGAAYAERDTDEPTSQIAWRYCTITNAGRLYYGFYNPVDDPVSPLVVFDQPTLDVPGSVQYGQTWKRSVAWTNEVASLYLVAYHFTASATVDAYGTLVLPNLGEVPALRVKELHDYEASGYFLDSWLPFLSQTNVYYYWLAPGLGMPVQILSIGDNVLDPTTPLPHTNEVLRAFSISYFTNPPPLKPVSELRIRLNSGLAILEWRQATNASSYSVETSGGLLLTNWQLLSLPATNSWSDPLTSTQRFYRVFYAP